MTPLSSGPPRVLVERLVKEAPRLLPVFKSLLTTAPVRPHLGSLAEEGEEGERDCGAAAAAIACLQVGPSAISNHI